MQRRKLIIGREVTDEENDLLNDCKEILDLSGNAFADTELFEDLKGNNFIFFYIIQACWGFLRSIFNCYVDLGYHSAYVLGRAIVEYYIDFCFLLKEDTKQRTEEYVIAWREGRDAFKKVKKFKDFQSIDKRADNVGLSKIYKKSYKSLCSFSHVNLKGSLLARGTNKAIKDRPKFLLHMMLFYLEILDIASRKLNITYPQRLAILIKDKIKKFESKINGERVDPNL